MTNERSCPCRWGVLTVTTRSAPFPQKLKPASFLLSFALLFGVMLFANADTTFAQQCQASGSLPMSTSAFTLTAGQTKTITVRITNTSSTVEASPNPVTANLTGTTVVKLNCADAACSTSFATPPLVFVPTGANGCVSSDPGVASCTAGANNTVNININSIPLGAGELLHFVASFQVQASVAPTCAGTIFEPGGTGAADLVTTSASCSPQVAGGAQGGTAEQFPIVCPNPSECQESNVCNPETNQCVITNKANSTACTDSSPGDCKIAGCEAGVCVQTHANRADSTACTSTADVAGDCGTPGCEAGVCVADHVPVSDSTPCSVGVTGTPGECATPGCESGVCVATHIPKSDSTACTDTTPGDCKTAGCESGVCVQTHGNVADSTACTSTADVAGDCGTPGCEAGVCVAGHVPVSDSTPCSVGVTGTPDECKTPGCENGVCVAAHINKPDSTACTDTTPDCGSTAGCEAGSCVQDHAPQDCGGGQGCTPGFWKANADKKQSNAWPVDPNTKLGTVFTIPPCLSSCSQNFANLTLRQALSLQGGNSLCEKAEILLRIATGSFLNASSSCVQFDLNPAALVAEVNGVLASCNASQFITESTRLDGLNNQGCPLNQQGQCSNP